MKAYILDKPSNQLLRGQSSYTLKIIITNSLNHTTYYIFY